MLTHPQRKDDPRSTDASVEKNSTEEATPEIGMRAHRKTFSRFILLLAGAALLLGIVHFSPLSGFFDDLQAFRDTLDDTGGLAAELLLLAANAIGVALGAPRLIFYALAGATFGVWKGLLLAQLGTLTGSFLTYRLVRRLGRQWVQRRFGERLRQTRILDGFDTSWSVFLFRQLPISSGILNLAFGLSRVRTWPFLIGSFFGYLPQGAIVLLIADGVMEEEMLDGVLQILVAIAALVCIGLWGLRRRSQIGNP